MEIVVTKEFDGKYYIGSCENLPNCYSQADNQDISLINLRKAIEIYRKSYQDKNQRLPEKSDFPVIDKKIRFNTISTRQLYQLLTKYHYRMDRQDNISVLLVNSAFPFNRIILPVTDDLSPVIITRLFGKENIIYINKSDLSMNSSA